MITLIIIILIILAIDKKHKENKIIKDKYKELTGKNEKELRQNVGTKGEFEIFKNLENIDISFNYNLCNIYLKKENGTTTEIDIISITKKGIFVFESKNYSGWIFGNEKNKYWTQTLKGNNKNKFYNPIKQNNGHIKELSKYLNINENLFFSYIVFGNNAELKKITIQSKNIKVIDIFCLIGILRKEYINLPDILSDEEVLEIYNKLKHCCLASEEVKNKHIEDIRNIKK